MSAVEQFMVNGESFRCDARDGQYQCGCNVFHKDERGRYVCNSCGAAYVGEKAESKESDNA